MLDMECITDVGLDEPPTYQAVATASTPHRQRPVHIELVAHTYAGASARSGHAIISDPRTTDRDVFLLSTHTTYRDLFERVTSELAKRSMGGFSSSKRTDFVAICVGDKKFRRNVRITAVNWDACREMLLGDASATVTVDACTGPEGWVWESAREEERKGEMERVEEARRGERKVVTCVVQ